jgi:hypothetical protein
MSYSYIKSVFPNYETSNAYDEQVYNSVTSPDLTLTLNPKEGTTSKLPAPLSAYDDVAMQGFAKTLLASEISAPETKLLEQYNNVQQSPPSKDNLRYYNLPIPQQYLQRSKESFENQTPDCTVDCDAHVKHVLGCSKCRPMIMKQLNIESDKIRNEEVMELISYIAFGIFMLILIDNLRRR